MQVADPTSKWREQLSFSDRLAQIVKITAEYKSAFPVITSAQASKEAKEVEAAILSNATEILDYYHRCNAAIEKIREQTSVRLSAEDAENGDEEDPRQSGGKRDIARYKSATHFANGIFSDIYKAVIPPENPPGFPGEPGRSVALKVTYPMSMEPPHNSSREIRILQKCASTHVMPLLESFKEPKTSSLVLVFPYMPYDLLLVLRKGYIAQEYGRTYLRGLFSALAHLHTLGIIHRDVKPSNILMKSLAGPVYLADFGIAWSPDDPASEPVEEKITDVGTSSYRAPEILFGKTSYDHTLDLWAAGCVAAEVVSSTSTTLFQSGDLGSDLTLIQSIFKALGTPTAETWPETKTLPDWGKVSWIDYTSQSWAQLLPDASETARGLVGSLVRYQSTERLDATAVLQHPYFGNSVPQDSVTQANAET